MGLRLGLLSTARINEKLMAGARLVDEVEVAAVASRSADRAAERRSRQEARRVEEGRFGGTADGGIHRGPLGGSGSAFGTEKMPLRSL